MNILNKIIVTVGALALSLGVHAQGTQDPIAGGATQEAVNEQWKHSLVRDGVVDRVQHNHRLVEWAPIREADVAWSRRIWRVIDTRQKQNFPFVYPGDEHTGGGAFIEILIDLVKKGKVAAYDVLDDRFTTPLNLEAFNSKLGGDYDTVPVIDLITGEERYEIVKVEFDIHSVNKYRIKEDWIFDRNQGRTLVRIVGIAPIKDEYTPGTTEISYSGPMFWLYYPELRQELVNYEVYNPQNDMHRINWAQYFDDRYFASYVIKTSAQNYTGAALPSNSLRAIQEGEEAMQEIFEMSMNMWEE